VVVGAILGLVAFLLAFTFNMAADWYDERRELVVDEANAVGTAYLRSALLPSEQREGMGGLFRDYVELRIATSRAQVTGEGLIERIERSEAIHRLLWARAMAASEAQPNVMTSLFIQSLNEVIDVHERRVQSEIRNAVPLSIWLGLFVVSAIGLAASGFQVGSTGGRRGGIAGAGLVLAFASALTLIADLDHPATGLLQTTQASLEDLLGEMDAVDVQEKDAADALAP